MHFQTKTQQCEHHLMEVEHLMLLEEETAVLTAEATSHSTAVSQVFPVTIVHANLAILPVLTCLCHEPISAIFSKRTRK